MGRLDAHAKATRRSLIIAMTRSAPLWMCGCTIWIGRAAKSTRPGQAVVDQRRHAPEGDVVQLDASSSCANSQARCCVVPLLLEP